MDTQAADTSTLPPENTPPPSLLDQIIKTSHESPHGDTDMALQMSEAIPPVITPKKPRDPMTAGTVLKLIGSLLLVAVIFFGSFLAYVVFNPDQAAFFVNIFGIDPNDIQNLLKWLINGSFGITVLIFSIVWIGSLFRAIWTPRDQKRRRLISWLTAGIVGIFLFSVLALWAFLFKTINATNYANLGGDVSVYDNDLYTHAESLPFARVDSTTSLVGPISLRYDISTNARTIAKKNLITITSYEINFDGAKCANDKSIMNGSDPTTEQGLICIFDQVRTYNIRGSYSGKNKLGEAIQIEIPLSTVEIKWLIEINTSTNKDGKKIMTISAAKVKNLWNPRWKYATTGSSEETKSSITETISATPLLVCLKLFWNACDRYFIISDVDTRSTEWSLVFQSDSINPLSVIMSLTGVTLPANEIVSIDWISSDGTRICQWVAENCSYVFPNYGSKTITATVRLANKTSYPIEWSIVINEPLIIARHAQIQDQDGKILNSTDTYDPTISGYVIRDLIAPTRITLDAQDVVSENLGYRVTNIVWKISNGATTTELVGNKVTYEVTRTERYTIEAVYTLEKNIVTNTQDTRTARDLIVLDLERKSLEPILKIQQSSDYTPAKVTFDASSSRSKNGTIQKFIFDFGEDKPKTEWDAVQVYEYRTPGQKKISLTIIDNNNEQVTISKYIVLKDTPKNIAFTTSMSPGVIAMPITFTAEGATGQIEEYIWNFWDNTPISKWYEIDHTFVRTGKYSISLTVRYTDGTEKTTTQSLQVDQSLE
jgi:PKD repeat protein